MSPIYYKAGFMLALAATTVILTACSGSAPNKQGSVWDQRRDSSTVAAPSAAEYKQELAAVDQSTSDVELSYQTEQINDFAPEAAADAESQGYDVVEPEATEAAAVASDTEASSAEQEILALPATNFTVQLFASVDIDRVYKFAEQSQISVQYIVPTVRDDVVWYVLLLDVYPDYSTAKASMEEVAPSLTTQPWVRSLGSVQKLIQ